VEGAVTKELERSHSEYDAFEDCRLLFFPR
jgi:hypothetical protein